MTGRGVRSADAAKDRRRATGQRVHFEAMVAVGGAEGGAAFEAESLDVSSEGMRLRTAYLPAIGDRLVCRFDGPGTELVAVGEVTWANEQARGGEFGLKFVDLDKETEDALREICGADADGDVSREEPGKIEKPTVARNARVKLHIEGLASPMKARVRDGGEREVCVGSSLEFLKLGRQVEVEDVDAGERREGFVDAVKVEVDPSTSVPQLVVSLRFDAIPVGRALPPPKEEAEPEVAPVTKVAGTPASKRSDEPRRSKPPVKETPQPRAEAAADQEVAASDASTAEDEIGAPNKLRAAQEKAKHLTTKAAASIGPAVAKMGDSARGFLSGIKDALERRREAREEAKKASAPRRVTAPPPSGALTSAGRRVVRHDASKDEDDGAPPPPVKKSRRGVLFGAAAGLALVVGVVGVSKAIGDKSEQAPGAIASSDTRTVDAASVPPIPGAPATADIPLYGPTPLSTTEQVIVPSPARANKSDDAEPVDSEPTEQKAEIVREWGQGTVKGGRELSVKMDGPVQGFSASETDDGFSIVVPKLKSVSSSSALVRKDKRLAGVDVENREDASEIRIKFKGEPPAYKVKVRGDRIHITLGAEGAADKKKAEPKKVASKPKKVTKKKAAPKKKGAKQD